MKSEIRNPKSERRPKPEIRIRTSEVGLLSDCGLRNSAFTLVEVILALAISAVVLAAICGVFTGAIRLREKTSEALDTALPLTEALDTLRQDLQSAMGPSNVLAGDFKCGGATMGENMGLSSAEGVGLDF